MSGAQETNPSENVKESGKPVGTVEGGPVHGKGEEKRETGQMPQESSSMLKNNGTDCTEDSKEQATVNSEVASKRTGSSLDEEREPLVPEEKEKAKEAASAAAWGWGSWASVVSVLQEAQKTATDAASGVLEQLDAEARAMEEEARGDAEAQTSASKDVKKDISPVEPGAQSQQMESQAVPSNEPATPANAGSEKQIMAVKDVKTVADSTPGAETSNTEFLLGQGLKGLDDSVESMASGALQALGSAWKGGLTFMQTLEQSAGTLAQSIQEGKTPALLESGMELAERSLRVLEFVGKETVSVIAQETGIELEQEAGQEAGEGEEAAQEAAEEEVTFEHCFYIYGGPEHLEELEALASHHSLLCTRARAKMSDDEKVAVDALLEEVQKSLLLRVSEKTEGPEAVQNEWPLADITEERVSMRDSSISTATEMGSGLASGLAGLPAKEMALRTEERLDSVRTEACHRVAELSAACVSLLLLAGGSFTAGETGKEGEEAGEAGNDNPPVIQKWPEAWTQKSELVILEGRQMAHDVQQVASSFLSAISEVKAAYDGAMGDSKVGEETTLADKSAASKEEIQADCDSAIEHIQTALKHLVYVLLSSTLKS